jgi:hypothetical protein
VLVEEHGRIAERTWGFRAVEGEARTLVTASGCVTVPSNSDMSHDSLAHRKPLLAEGVYLAVGRARLRGVSLAAVDAEGARPLLVFSEGVRRPDRRGRRLARRWNDLAPRAKAYSLAAIKPVAEDRRALLRSIGKRDRLSIVGGEEPGLPLFPRQRTPSPTIRCHLAEDRRRRRPAKALTRQRVSYLTASRFRPRCTNRASPRPKSAKLEGCEFKAAVLEGGS